MKIAAAQINSVIGEINTNLELHYQMINFAIKKGAKLITFPEMSITGYCRKEGNILAFSKNDSRLFKLQELSVNNDIIIIAGAPISILEKLFIGSFIFRPDNSIEIYTKQYLHKGEELFYDSSFEFNPTIKLGKEKIALAICADINNPKHPESAKRDHSTLYIPSIFFSLDGIEKGHKLLKTYAHDFSLNILMSNYHSSVWGIESGGKSAFWNDDGKLLTELDTNQNGIIIIEKEKNKWTSKVYQKINSASEAIL